MPICYFFLFPTWFPKVRRAELELFMVKLSWFPCLKRVVQNICWTWKQTDEETTINSTRIDFHLSKKTGNWHVRTKRFLSPSTLGIISLYHKVFCQQLSCENFCSKKYWTISWVTVKNQPVARPPLTSYVYSQAKHFFLLNQLKISTVTDLVENFKSQTLSRKISIS